MRASGGDDATTRVVLVDDHAVVTAGLRAYLDALDGLEVVATGRDVADGLAAVRATRPDVVVADLLMPGGTTGRTGGETLVAALAAEGGPPVLVLSSARGEDAVGALRSGARGFVGKHAEPAVVAEAVRVVAEGGEWLDPAATAAVLGALRARTPAPLAELTTREREVLELLADGRSNAEIARELVIAVKTVKTHVSNVLRKLDVADRTQAAVLALRHGIGRGS